MGNTEKLGNKCHRTYQKGWSRRKSDQYLRVDYKKDKTHELNETKWDKTKSKGKNPNLGIGTEIRGIQT